jgi:hypothetical protein
MNNTVQVGKGGGFFSCCSCRLDAIVDYINTYMTYPDNVDSSKQFNPYKIGLPKNQDITFVYFEHYNNINTNLLPTPIIYNQSYQWHTYKNLNFEKLSPIVEKYFTPSTEIKKIKSNIEIKYAIDYANICVLFYRGNDKGREIILCGYDVLISKAREIKETNPNIKFLIQSDESEFIEAVQKEFPDNSFYFKDEIRHMSKTRNTVDLVFRNDNFKFSKYFLAITLIMSQCKYVICASGNCDIWITLFRKNCDNVFQCKGGKVIQGD